MIDPQPAMEDKAAIYSAVRARGISIGILIFLLAILSGITFGFFYLRKQKKLYERLFHLELERNKSLDLFRTTLYSIGDGVLTTDEGGKVRNLNRAAQSLTGWTEAEAQGRPVGEIFRIVEEGSLSALENPMNRVLRDGVTLELANHTLLVSRDGSTRPITDSGALIRSIGDTIQGAVLVFRDQTEQREAQRLLREQEEFFHDLFEYLTIGVAIYEAVPGSDDFIVKDMNLAGQRYSKVDIREVAGKRLLTVFPGARKLGLVDVLSKVLVDGKPRQISMTLYHDTRISEWVENSVFRMPSGYVVAIYRDVSEQKKAEDELLSSLRQKEALLKEVHHRVKNNLQIISSLLSLQSDQLTDEADRALFLESRQRVWAMAALHDQLYASSDFTSIDFPSYIQRLVVNLMNAYGGEERHISVSLEVQDVSIDMDRAIACGLIVNELVTNALKHAFPAGRPGTIRIACRRREADSLLCLSVADDGQGPPDNQILDATRGLGLRLVRILADQIGGDLALETSSGFQASIFFRSNA